ncbi:hypothetical protein GQ600_9485 [Phytophthora cactorum]|nr:hypothetical protein GQ600_9485 [Phytophthora cactorum]
MGYLVLQDKPQYDNRADVNKTFLASTIRGVNSHNRRQEEDKWNASWTIRETGGLTGEATVAVEEDQTRENDDAAPVEAESDGKKNEEDERSYWARKKADKTRKLWENLHSEGTVSVENAPDFSSEESDDDDVKPKP